VTDPVSGEELVDALAESLEAMAATLRSGESAVVLADLESAVMDLHCFLGEPARAGTGVLGDGGDAASLASAEARCDLRSAVCCAVSGDLDAAAGCLRSAHDLGTLAVFLRHRAGDDPDTARAVACADPPGWGSMIPRLRDRPSVRAFDASLGCDFVAELCAHRASLRWLCSDAGRRLRRFAASFRLTVSWSAALWLVSFPELCKSRLDTGTPFAEAPERLVVHSRGWDAVRFALSRTTG